MTLRTALHCWILPVDNAMFSSHTFRMQHIQIEPHTGFFDPGPLRLSTFLFVLSVWSVVFEALLLLVQLVMRRSIPRIHILASAGGLVAALVFSACSVDGAIVILPICPYSYVIPVMIVLLITSAVGHLL